MEIKECYEKMHGNYDDAIGRLSMDKLVEKFMLKFLNDPTMDSLRAAVAEGNIEESFKAAHTLKGVAANLAFTKLYEAADRLTEQLRPQTEPASTELMEIVEINYDLVTNTIKEYQSQM